MSKKAKIILSVDDSFLFGIKRTPNDPGRDGKLELLGGGLDKGETPLEALIREVAEEEPSSIVADKIAHLEPTPMKITVDDDRQFIFHMAITKEELDGITLNTKEHYGYRLMERSAVVSAPKLDLSVFTRKTVKIFAELRRLNLFPYHVD